jgi:glyoxylase I family protein
MNPMAISTSSVAHVRLTVTDIERSRQFYESVFGWPILIELPQDADATTRARLGFLYGGVIYDAGATLIGLRPVGRDMFDENRTGLDHLAFRLRNLEELNDAVQHLDDLGIEHEPVKDIGPSHILEFRDPDNIALELTAPK